MTTGALSLSWLTETVRAGVANVFAGTREQGVTTDEQLLAQMKTGRGDALDQLMERHADAIFTCLRRRVAVRETAEDLYQEAWIRVVERCDTYRDGAPVRPWLYRIALNVLADHYRREQALRRGGGASHVPLDDPGAVPSAVSHPPCYADREEQGTLHRAVENLPESFREVIRLRYFEELSTAEVAEVLGCAQGTVKSRLSRGLEMLQAEMEKLS